MSEIPVWTEISIWAPAMLAGGALGAIFFGGLWWTVRRGLHSGSPAAWFLGSLVLRTGIAVFGFYAVSHGDWRKWLACLLGFLAARIGVTKLTHGALEAAP